MRIKVGDTQLFVDVMGSGYAARKGELVEKPTLVLLHGGPGYDHTNLRRFHRSLTRQAQVLFFDQRGHGRSDPCPPEQWNLARWADDVKELCDALGITKPIVMGASFGGMVAQTYAARHPEHPRGLILHSTAARFNHDAIVDRLGEMGGPEARAAAIALWEAPGDPERLATYTKLCMSHYTYGSPAPDPQAVKVEVNLDILTHFYAPGAEGRLMDRTEANARIICPTLVLAGVQDPITVVEEADIMVNSLCNADVSYLRVEKAGHGVYHDHPELVRTAMKRFIRELT